MKTYRQINDPTAQKQQALSKAANYIQSVLRTKKPFIDFDYIYGTGVLFRGLTREEVEELYNSIK